MYERTLTSACWRACAGILELTGGWHAGTYDSVNQVHHEKERPPSSEWLGASDIGDGDLALGLQQNLAFHTYTSQHAFLEG